MSSRSETILRLRSGFVVASIVLASGLAMAQEEVRPPSADPSMPSMDVTVRNETRLTGPEQLAWVDRQAPALKQIAGRVQAMLDRARRDKDAIRITCLNDKLTQINVNLRGVEERRAALRTAVAGRDTATANQQFTVLKIYTTRIQGLMGEAEACVGEVDVVLGDDNEVIVTIDPNITNSDPASRPDVEIGVDQPPHASGFY